MARIIDVVLPVPLVVGAAARTQRGILLGVGSSCGDPFTERLVVGTVGGFDRPEGMEAVGAVLVVLLQVHHFVRAVFLVIERHRVAATSYLRIVIGGETGLIR